MSYQAQAEATQLVQIISAYLSVQITAIYYRTSYGIYELEVLIPQNEG